MVGVLLSARYRLEQRIAAGGMGEVWRGTDMVLGRPVAVKLLRHAYIGDESLASRFRAEARYAASLSHPGIAQVFDYGEQDTRAGGGSGAAAPTWSWNWFQASRFPPSSPAPAACPPR